MITFNYSLWGICTKWIYINVHWNTWRTCQCLTSLNPLNTKRRLLYLKTQFEPRRLLHLKTQFVPRRPLYLKTQFVLCRLLYLKTQFVPRRLLYLKTQFVQRRLLYLKTQFLPRSKYFSSWLWKPGSLCCRLQKSLFTLRKIQNT